MGKTSRILLAGLLLAAGCSRTYRGERLLWRAHRESRAVLERPAEAAAEQARRTIELLEAVVREAPGSPSAAQAQLLIAHVYTVRGQAQQARDVYEQILRTQSREPRALLSAMTALASLDWKANRIGDAKQRLWDIAERFPWTEVGLQAPSDAAELEERSGGRADADWDRAVQWYARKRDDAPSPLVEASIRGHLAAVYQHQGKWEDAARELDVLAQSKEPGLNRAKVLYDLALLYSSRLSNPAKSRALFEEVVKHFPEDPFGRAAQARLDGK